MMLKTLIYGKGKGARSAEFLENRAPIRSMPFHLKNKASIYCNGDHIYIACGQGKPLVFCHGLFGGIFNIDRAAFTLSEHYRFIMPFLPMYDLPLSRCRVKILGEYLDDFTAELRLENAVFIGSSMGGGAAAYFASNHPHKVKGLVLCGSSGLSNIPISSGFFKRKNYGFVRSATQDIFYNRNVPPGEMVDEVFQVPLW